ncbi:FxSxx-COOH system tetratricopeptide repeat protein [Streptomyces sp. JB150]|uniref:FxSxx-COOH system tetratricopeptide repeat protein n=1 Tax=Streptomyces sp. JB150 TaxID=2714844 RepID=UPI001407B5E0|nr:FxSxx-COOH system tetratricopeptide repeat protein [Streptomyces sp. JB150]QIJ62018.1 tetratricopeptide repeat protein [Streptomyces sp. JB150]
MGETGPAEGAARSRLWRRGWPWLIGVPAALGSYATALATLPGDEWWRYPAAAASAVAAAGAVVLTVPRDAGHPAPQPSPPAVPPRPRVAVRAVSGDATWAAWLTDVLELSGRQAVWEPWEERPSGPRETALTVVLVSAATAAWPAPPVPAGPHLYLCVEECAVPAGAMEETLLSLAGLPREAAAGRLLDRLDALAPVSPPVGGPADGPRLPPCPGLDAAVTNLPPRNVLFTDRSDVLDRVGALFLGPHPVTAARSCAVVGVGGVGKSQVAVEYGHRFASHYDTIWWVRAESRVQILDALTLLARRLDVPVDDDPAVTLGALWRALGARRRWLLVFDNAVDAADLDACWPPLTNGDVLITSYVRTWPGGRITDIVALDVFDEADAVAFLRRRSNDHRTSAATAGTVARALGRLPLVLEQAAAYTQETGTTLAEFERVLQRQPSSAPLLSQESWYRPEMTATWTMALERACEQQPHARSLALLLAFLAADRVPRALLTDHAHALPPPLRDRLSGDLAVNALLRPLLSFSLIRADDHGDLGVSRQIQDHLRSTLDAAGHRWHADAAVLLVESAFPADPADPHRRPECARLLPHVLSVVRHGGASGTGEPAALGRLLHRAGTYLHVRGDYGHALELLGRSVDVQEADADGDPTHLAGTVAALGRTHYALAALDDAHRCADRAVRLLTGHFGPDHPRVARQLLWLSRIEREQGLFAQALDTARRALEVTTRARGEDHPDTAACLMVLGDAQWRRGDLDAARDCYRRALAVREATPGTRPVDLATAHKHLALIALDRGEPRRAHDDLVRARALLTAAHDEDHPAVADVDNHLGEALRRLGRTEEAHTALRHALAVRGPLGDHPDVVGTLIRLGRLHRDTGALEESYACLTEARRMAAAAMGAEHPYVADAECDLAATLAARGERERATAVLGDAVRRYERAYGPGHPVTADARARLAALGGPPAEA